MNDLKNLLNEFRGIEVTNLNTSNQDDEYIIEFRAECTMPLSNILATENMLDIYFEVFCDMDFVVTYCAYFSPDVIDNFIRLLNDIKDLAHNYEGFNQIPLYNNTNLENKEKIINYVKFARQISIGGFSSFCADGVLEITRGCEHCGKELCSQYDQMQSILEFNDPKTAFEKFRALDCEF